MIYNHHAKIYLFILLLIINKYKFLKKEIIYPVLIFEKYSYNKAKFSLEKKNNIYKFYKNTQTIEFNGGKYSSPKDNKNINIYLFEVQMNRLVINVNFTGNCPMPIFMMTILNKENELIKILDKDDTSIEISAEYFAPSKLRYVKYKKIEKFNILTDFNTEYEKNFKSQKALVGDAKGFSYQGIIFCPYFQPNNTFFSFDIDSSKIDTSHKIDLREDMDNKKYIIEYASKHPIKRDFDLKEKNTLFLEIGNLFDITYLHFNITREEAEITLEYEYIDSKEFRIQEYFPDEGVRLNRISYINIEINNITDKKIYFQVIIESSTLKKSNSFSFEKFFYYFLGISFFIFFFSCVICLCFKNIKASLERKKDLKISEIKRKGANIAEYFAKGMSDEEESAI